MSNLAVVKIGGALLETPEAAVKKILSEECSRLAVVHGGGVQITRMLEKMNVRSEFIDGLRVTDELTLAAVAAALLGEVHTTLVRSLQRRWSYPVERGLRGSRTKWKRLMRLPKREKPLQISQTRESLMHRIA